MTSTFQLALDTHAPVITWGSIADPVASEEMTVYYTLTEPGVVQATVTLLDGRALPMQIYGDRLTVVLPDDAPEGDAIVHVVLRDSVANTATSDLPVHVTGTVGPVEPPVPVGLPSPPTRAPARSIVWEDSTARVSSAYSQTAVWVSVTRLRASSRYVTPRRARWTIREELVVGSADGLTVRVSTRSECKLSEDTTIRKRPLGPGIEAELIALGLL